MNPTHLLIALSILAIGFLSVGFLIGVLYVARRADQQRHQAFLDAMERDSAETERREIIESV